MLLYLCIFIFLIGCFLIINKNELSYLGAMIISFVLSIPELYFEPIQGLDIFNYFRGIKEISLYDNFFQFIQMGKYDPILGRNSGCVIFDYIEWLVSKTSIYNLLPFFVMLVICLSLFIPCIYQMNKYKIKLSSMVMGLFLILGVFPYYNASSTLRWALASSIFFIITYFCCKNQKKNIQHIILYMILYLSTCLIHEAMITPSMVAVFCVLWTYEKKFRLYFILIFSLLVLLIVIKLGSKDIKLFHDYETFSVFSTSVGSLTRLKVSGTVIGPFIYSIGSLSFLHNNKNGIPLIISTMFYAFNLLAIVFLPLFVITQRYIICVATIDVICFLESQRKDKYNLRPYAYICFIIPGIMLDILSIMGLPYMTFSNIILSY